MNDSENQIPMGEDGLTEEQRKAREAAAEEGVAPEVEESIEEAPAEAEGEEPAAM